MMAALWGSLRVVPKAVWKGMRKVDKKESLLGG
jgi:hypothetical protein